MSQVQTLVNGVSQLTQRAAAEFITTKAQIPNNKALLEQFAVESQTGELTFNDSIIATVDEIDGIIDVASFDPVAAFENALI